MGSSQSTEGNAVVADNSVITPDVQSRRDKIEKSCIVNGDYAKQVVDRYIQLYLSTYFKLYDNILVLIDKGKGIKISEDDNFTKLKDNSKDLLARFTKIHIASKIEQTSARITNYTTYESSKDKMSWDQYEQYCNEADSIIRNTIKNANIAFQRMNDLLKSSMEDKYFPKELEEDGDKKDYFGKRIKGEKLDLSDTGFERIGKYFFNESGKVELIYRRILFEIGLPENQSAVPEAVAGQGQTVEQQTATSDQPDALDDFQQPSSDQKIPTD